MWRAQVDGSGGFFQRSVRLRLGEEHPDGSFDIVSGVTEFGDLILTRVSDGTAGPDFPGLALPEAALPAVLAALARHLGAVEHPEQLRRDYDAERARVDLMMKALLGRVV